MSASLFAKLLVVPRQLPAVSRLSWRTAASSENSGGSKKASKEPKKPAEKEPKKPAEQLKTSAAAKPSGATPAAPAAQKPFDNSKYQANELFEYNNMSFYDIEVDMSSQRCPVPSSLKKEAAA